MKMTNKNKETLVAYFVITLGVTEVLAIWRLIAALVSETVPWGLVILWALVIVSLPRVFKFIFKAVGAVFF